MKKSNKVSVPTKGTHLLYARLINEKYDTVRFRPHEGDPSSLLLPWFALNAIHSFRPHEGDPSSLLHNKSILAWLVSYCFRPHEGDPSSLQLYTILSEVQNELFPSPRRGPIFSTENLAWTKVTCEFPSPRRGPIFSTRTE